VIYDGQLIYAKYIIEVSVILIFISILLITNYVFIKKGHVIVLVKRHSKGNISKMILYLLIVILPVFFILITGSIMVFLFGGKALGYEITGLL